MPIARGIVAQIAMWDEATYGVKPATPLGENMQFRSAAVKGSLARIIDETLSGRRGTPSSIAGQRDVGGQIMTTLSGTSSLRLLRHLVGGPVSTGGASPYTHSFGLASALPASFGMQFDYGAAIATPGRFLQFRGCRMAKGSFKFGATGYVDCTWDVRGADFDLTPAVTADALLDDFGHVGFSMMSAVITEGGSPIADLTDLQIDWDNDMDDSLYTIGGLGVRGELPEGFAKIGGTVNALFRSPTLINKGINSTDTALVISLQNGTGLGTVGNEKITFTLPNLLYDVSTPEISGPKGIKVGLNFTAHRVASAENAATVVVLSGRASVL